MTVLFHANISMTMTISTPSSQNYCENRAKHPGNKTPQMVDVKGAYSKEMRTMPLSYILSVKDYFKPNYEIHSRARTEIAKRAF